ncbi:hypothetical protein LVD15_07770 [Fulvivirga maritima]|uniref:hypothetical protein n=1 Tax=Fulvivirga maritima TaxID=2904247 RepID=UPI001F2A39F6|nr:hypothetical protein [Fulvivirga maritima]UII28315.1 hypothetical protein LVD15_07770 [Fulvivirga maritima]
MGLQEKKAIQGIKDQYFNDYQKELNEVVGKELPIDIQWDTFNTDLNAIKFIPSVCLQRTVDAFKEICSDAIGKEAIQESVQTIVVHNIEPENAEANKSLVFDGGVFTIRASYGGHHSGFFTDLQIREYLENAL